MLGEREGESPNGAERSSSNAIGARANGSIAEAEADRRRRDERRDSAETLLRASHRASRERKKKKKNHKTSIDRSIQLSPLDAARPAVTPTDLTHTPRHRASGGCRADNRDDADVQSRNVFQHGDDGAARGMV